MMSDSTYVSLIVYFDNTCVCSLGTRGVFSFFLYLVFDIYEHIKEDCDRSYNLFIDCYLVNK